MAYSALVLDLRHADQAIRRQRQERGCLSNFVQTNEPVGVLGGLDLDNAGMHFALQLLVCPRWYRVSGEVPERFGVIEILALPMVVLN